MKQPNWKPAQPSWRVLCNEDDKFIDLLKIKYQEERVANAGGFTRARSAGEVTAIMQQLGQADIYTPYRGHTPSKNNLSRKKVDI